MAVWFIILIFYVIFAGIFIMANMVLKKTYFNYVVLSHLSEIMCLICMICLQLNIYHDKILFIIKSCAFMFFTSSILLGYIALKKLVGLETKKHHVLFYIILIIVNTFLSVRAPYYVVYTDKFILMSLFIYAAIHIFINNKQSGTTLLFSFIIAIFPLIQLIIGIKLVAFNEVTNSNIEWGVYVLQSITYALAMLLYSINEIKKESNTNAELLNQVIKMDKSRMIAVSEITHELKTPINIISSSIQLLDERYIRNDCYDADKVKEYMDIMKKNSYRIIKIANNFIDVNKAEYGAFEVNYEMCDIVNVIESITMSAVPFAESKNVQLIFDTNLEEYAMLCDTYKLERIMLNLISNAIKFTNPNHGMVYVELFIGSSKVYITVKDNGRGISEDKQETIFDKFSSQSKEEAFIEGSGLGLSLVKAFVDILEGDIELKSKKNEGAAFTISLPIKIGKNSNVKLYTFENERKMNIEFSDIV